MKYVVVTGVSTGIGWGIAQVLIQNQIHVFGTVRNEKTAKRLQEEWGTTYFTPLLLDVRDAVALDRAVEKVRGVLLPEESLWGLVNNAGVAHFGPLALQSMDEIKETLDINILGAIQVTQKFLPLLGMEKRRQKKGARPGRIINISSIAGKIGTPFLGIYAASKHAMEGWSESLRRELMIYGIDVIIIGPGSVATPIWDKAEAAGMERRYQGTDYEAVLDRVHRYMLAGGRRGLSPEELGRGVYQALKISCPRTRYTFAPDRFKNWTLPRMLPSRWMDRLVGKKIFGLGFFQKSRFNEP